MAEDGFADPLTVDLDDIGCNMDAAEYCPTQCIHILDESGKCIVRDSIHRTYCKYSKLMPKDKLQQEKKLAKILAHESSIDLLAWDTDGKSIIASSIFDYVIYIWSIAREIIKNI